MDIYFFISLIFALQLVAALPQPVNDVEPAANSISSVEEDRAKIREKRKLNDGVMAPKKDDFEPKEPSKDMPTGLPSLPPVDASDDTEKDGGSPKKLTGGNKDLKPEHNLGTDAGGASDRVKKQACVKVPCGTKTVCGSPAGEAPGRNNHPELVVVKQDEPIMPVSASAMEVRQPNGARTIEPIYSFGPVSLTGASGGAYGSNPYGVGSYPVRPIVSGSASLSNHQMSYAAPGGMQYQVLMPYPLMPHRHLLHHSMTVNHGGAVEAKPEVVYYEAPEPIYVEAEDHNAVQSAQPVSLYCQTMKSKDLAKALVPTEEKLNSTADAAGVQDHIERVNQIKDEISQLNQAAQRIVDQQERLARLQEDHMSAASAKSVDPYIAPMMRFHESFRTTPYAYGQMGQMGYLRPHYYRDAQEGSYGTAPAEDPKPPASNPAEAPKKAEPASKPKEAPQQQMEQPQQQKQQQPPPLPYDMYRQEYYPSYGGYYGYRSDPGYAAPYYRSEFPSPILRSETGFPVPPLFLKSNGNVADYPSNQEDVKFFMRMLDMGKRMGVLSNDYQPSGVAPVNMKKAEEVIKSENLLDDLANGGADQSKNDHDDKPSKIDVINPEKPEAPKKMDKRGLIHKKV